MATVGEDFGKYRAWLDSKGIDTSLMKSSPGSLRLRSLLRPIVPGQIASFYPGAMGHSSVTVAERPPREAGSVVVSPMRAGCG